MVQQIPKMTPKKVFIPFRPDMTKAVLEERKCCTSRTKRYAEPGDWFDLGRHRFKITAVERIELDTVAHILFKEEGVESPQEFIDLWEEIHPGRGFDPLQKVWTHFFEEVGTFDTFSVIG